MGEEDKAFVLDLSPTSPVNRDCDNMTYSTVGDEKSVKRVIILAAIEDTLLNSITPS